MGLESKSQVLKLNSMIHTEGNSYKQELLDLRLNKAQLGERVRDPIREVQVSSFVQGSQEGTRAQIMPKIISEVSQPLASDWKWPKN